MIYNSVLVNITTSLGTSQKVPAVSKAHRWFRGATTVPTANTRQVFQIAFSVTQNTWYWMTLNHHLALNSVRRQHVWSSEAWLSRLVYP